MGARFDGRHSGIVSGRRIVIANGRIVYSRAGWVTAQHSGYCALCGGPLHQGDRIIRVNASTVGSQWAGQCCEHNAEVESGNPYLIAHHQCDTGAAFSD